MPIIRSSRPQDRFYVVRNSISNNRSLSWAARGMLIFLLSKPDNWQVSVTNLIAETNSSSRHDGKTAVYAILKELIEAGYVTRKKHASGEINYFVCELPEPDSEKPDTENPNQAFKTQVNTEKAVRTETPPKKESSTDLFEQFWQAYPKKDGKVPARTAFKKIKTEEFAEIMLALAKFKQREDWKKDKGQFVPMASTWINQRRWEDLRVEDRGSNGLGCTLPLAADPLAADPRFRSGK